MQIKNTKINSSGDSYRDQIKYPFDGLANNHTYLLDLYVESQNYNGGTGMIQEPQITFHTNYPEIILKNKPTLTQLADKSAVQVDWASLYQNPGNILNTFSFLDNFIIFGNTALSLDNGSVLQYNLTTIPNDFTLQFMIKLAKNFNGIIFNTSDNQYQIGYDGSLQKFYTIIDNVTDYSELIKITDNPFFITILSDHIIIKQYNIYKKLSNIKGYKLSDMSGYPLGFMGQSNN